MLDTILRPIELAVAWIMVMCHNGLSLVLPAASGWTWVLSIVGLVIVIRVILIPLFVKQIRSSRAMQMIQPEIKKIQQKYKGKTDQGSRQAQSQEMMQAYKDAKTNPFASCLPLILQMPIFFALFRVLNYKLEDYAVGGKNAGQSFGILTSELATQARESTFAVGVGIKDTFTQGDTTVKIVAGILIAGMVATTFLSQRQLTMKNLPPSALEGPMAQQQKVLLYVLPFIFVFSGPIFPIGVLVYWLTTNIWSMAQQFIVIRNSPTPGSEAERNYRARINAKRLRRGQELIDFDARAKEAARPKPKTGVSPAAEIEPPPKTTGQRQQPVRKKRQSPQPPRGGVSSGQEDSDAVREARARRVANRNSKPREA